MTFEQKLHKVFFEGATWGNQGDKDSWGSKASDQKNAMEDIKAFLKMKKDLEMLDSRDIKQALSVVPDELRRKSNKPRMLVDDYKERLMKKLYTVLRTLRRNLDEFPELKKKYGKHLAIG